MLIRLFASSGLVDKSTFGGGSAWDYSLMALA